MNTVEKFIEDNWQKCIKEERKDRDTVIGVPYPYTVPAVGHFNELYYWDTYFTNIGLLCSKHYIQAKLNTDNILYLIDKFGYMPNGSRTGYIGRTQPPFASIMVRDIYEFFGDKVWLIGAYETLKKEYDFWMTNRILPVGLNTYGGISKGNAEKETENFKKRVAVDVNIDANILKKHIIASYESGWDITPRFGFELYNYAPVDLNSLMYMFEMNMSYFSSELQKGEEKLWESRAVKRKALILKYMENEDNLLLDYNMRTDTCSNIFSVASLYPMFAKMADERHINAIFKNLYRLEYNYGLVTCEKNYESGSYQWNYPNGWPCLQYIAIKAFINYGYKNEAKRIAEKYVALVEDDFEKTDNLWEKYNVVEGNINVTNEYDMPPMMGWSAGVYLACRDLLKEI